MKDLPLHFALFLMGVAFIISQVLVIRELLVVFVGNELSIAIILANWLMLGALGSYGIGRKTQKWALGRKSFALFQMLQALFLPLTILAIRSLRGMMGLLPGEAASLWQVGLWTFPLLAPLGILGGALFSLGCSLYENRYRGAAISVGRVYLLEALGAGIGGGIYTFVLIPGFHSFQIAYGLGTAGFLSAFFLMLANIREAGAGQKILAALSLGLVAGGLWLWSSPHLFDLEAFSLRRQWPGFFIRHVDWSPYGNITVSQREEQFTFYSNGLPVLVSPVPDIAQIEDLIHLPLLSHERPEKVLIVGGGLGGVIAEVLKHPVKEVHYVELDPLMIDLARRFAPSTVGQETEDPRVRIHALDGRFFIKKTSLAFDLILINLPGPFTLQLNRFYTSEFFQEARRALSDQGMITLVLPGAEAYLSKEARDLNVSLIETLKEVFPSVWAVPGPFHLVFACRAADRASGEASSLKKRLEERNLSTRYLTPLHLDQKLDPYRRAWMEESFRRGERPRANRDVHPRGLYLGIAYWNAEFHPTFQKFWGPLDRLPLEVWMGLLFLLAGSMFLLGRKKSFEKMSRRILVGVIVTTGFLGMAMNILVIFSFQTLYGYVFQWMGVLIAAFMAGLALGSWAMTRWVQNRRDLWRSLRRVEGAMIGWMGLGMVFLGAWNSILSSSLAGPLLLPLAFSIWNGWAGFLVGLEFPLANALWVPHGKGVAEGAGTLYAADLLGAWAGALWVGVVWIPLYGLWATLGLLIGLKVGSWLWVRFLG